MSTAHERTRGPGCPDPSLPRRHPAVEEQPFGTEVLLYHEERGVVGILNETAHFIWRHCDGRHTPAAIADALARHFTGAGRYNLEAHTLSALALLREGGLLLPESGDESA